MQGNRINARVIKALDKSPHFANLKHLDLYGNLLGDRGLKAIDEREDFYPTFGTFSTPIYEVPVNFKGREILLWIAKGKVFPRKNILNIKNNTIYFENDKVKVDYIVLCTGYNISHLQKQTNAILYSKTNEENILTSNVLIIDNIGMLSNIYKY